ncbi:MurT ligase domain-containing protein [Micrococcoides hystricis]|uniref:Lipid II isoglutaminyl synthase (glutamine-hydrolyzing) subunit MurT n=1 Tax=Micrococcoides hystricis TaxID=1572761 RepID=A0ABV6PB51_9MICC
MFNALTVAAGKAVKRLAKLRGGGSALPGLVVEKLDKGFLSRTLAQLPYGVVVVSGTNGKTTTTKMVVELLRARGLRVFTNDTGSNFVRGVLAALMNEVDAKGRLDADIAVLELDEAHAVHFVAQVKPRHALLLNVMRDQLDRFGEVDYTASLLAKIAAATTGTVVTNRHDRRLLALGKTISDAGTARVDYFGLSETTAAQFPDDAGLPDDRQADTDVPTASVVLEELQGGSRARFTVAGADYSTQLKLTGLYNIYNAAAALALARAVLPEHLQDDAALVRALANVEPAFGRGESLEVNGQPLELVLVKNPAGFRLALASFSPTGYATMIAVNDAYADGRDLSWLWDVDFESLREAGVDMVCGVRAHEMGLRLYYDQVPVAALNTDVQAAMNQFLETHPDQPKRIFCTYTAMLALRKQLGTMTDVETAIQ